MSVYPVPSPVLGPEKVLKSCLLDPSIYPLNRLPTHPSIDLSNHPFIHPSIQPASYLSTHPFTYPFIHLPIHHLIPPSIHPLIYLPSASLGVLQAVQWPGIMINTEVTEIQSDTDRTLKELRV